MLTENKVHKRRQWRGEEGNCRHGSDNGRVRLVKSVEIGSTKDDRRVHRITLSPSQEMLRNNVTYTALHTPL